MKKRGYSLIELVVSIAILSVVGMAMMGLITYSINAYHKTSDNASLQYEMQLASNRLEEQILAADKGISCGTSSVSLYNAPDDTTKQKYVIYLDGSNSQLLLQEYIYDGTNWVVEGDSECFASYVKSFDIKVFDKNGNEIPFPNIGEKEPQKVTFSLEMEIKNESQKLDYTVALRNDILATDNVEDLYE